AMLTQPYRIRGLVVHGAQRGRKLGFPTANVDAIDTLLPGQGIYAGRALAQGTWWPAALSIGPNPTFDEHALKVEAYLLDFDARIYGDPIEIDFLARLRDVETFESVDQLVAQLHRDVADTRRIVDTMPTG
ncbi:MAG: bifunctional riboflavin kinase/FAD synthetase, partial [Planctomycetes bacterium]|nr:bifunctional riboflavin kinase/FAD synthetase [Planctomycetota bacterium]